MNVYKKNTIRRHLQILARQAEGLEQFIAKALQRVGELVDARLFILHIQDLRQDRQVIHATLYRRGTGWKLLVDDTDIYGDTSSGKRSHPSYLLHSYFCFSLDLPSKWSGTLLIEYPGITMLTARRHRILTAILSELSDSLYLALINQRVRELEIQDREKERINQELRQTITNLSKEAYCVSSVVTGLTQSLNVVKIFTRILGSTLSMVKARIGDVYFPETDQYITMQPIGSQFFSFEDDHERGLKRSKKTCLKDYFEKKLSQLTTIPDGVSFNFLPLDGPLASPFLKKRFKSFEVQSVFEFSLCFGNELFGLGLIGFSEGYVREDKSRLFLITLNMTNLFLEKISLMRNLEHEVKLKSKKIQGMEKKQRFLLDHGSRPFSLSSGGQTVSSKEILEEIDRSHKSVFLGELASGVAHQIRNPLNNLIAVLHLLKNTDPNEEEDRGQLIDQVTERVETINQMIHKFIHYTRIPELNLTSESINGVLKNSVQAFKGWADLARVEVITDFDPRLLRTKLDLYLMDQVYHNIIKNALEAMYRNGTLSIFTQKLKIKHGPAPRLEFAEIMFQDSGPGIPREDADKVLNPFFSRKKDGIGLGLAIVDHVVGRHGGGVRIKTKPGKGTTVTLYLPIR